MCVRKPSWTCGGLNSTRKRSLKARLPQKCAYCGSTSDLTLDHILARALGGDNSIANLQILCSPCNQKKAIRESKEFERRIAIQKRKVAKKKADKRQKTRQRNIED